MKPDSVLPSLFDHALVALLILALSGVHLTQPIWHVNPVNLLTPVLFAGAYVAAGLVVELLVAREGRLGSARVMLVGFAAFGLAFVVMLLAEMRYPTLLKGDAPRLIALTSVAVGVPALVLLNRVHGALVGSKGAYIVPALLAATVLAAHLGVSRSVSGAAKAGAREASQQVSFLDTSLYVLKVTTYRNGLPGAGERGGAVSAFGDGYLVAAGNGGIYFVREADDRRSLVVRKLAHAVPFNPEEFLTGARKIFGASWKGNNNLEKLRIADLLIQELPEDRVRVVVSHHFWHVQEACATVRLSVLETGRGDLLAGAQPGAWKTLYESSPCLSLNAGGHRGARFGGIQIGGAMALLSDRELLVTVGDHEFDGWNRTPVLPQQADNDYGKVILIRLDTGNAGTYSSGHRNPQGIAVDPQGNVWETEHGPRGGDELNRVVRGANYGWPLATYGTDYRLHKWPLEGDPSLAARFEAPIMAFVPSIALSALTRIDGERFPAWRGNLLLASLSGQLRRVVFSDGRPVVTEPFALDARLRDVAQGRDGRIVLWTDTQDLVFLEPAASGAAEELVFQCTGCHTLSSWERASIGPNLWRIVGRPVARDEEFAYSEAMSGYGGRWDRERLDRFLADPAAAVPGNTMQFDGIADAMQREKLIDYLERLSDTPR